MKKQQCGLLSSSRAQFETIPLTDEYMTSSSRTTILAKWSCAIISHVKVLIRPDCEAEVAQSVAGGAVTILVDLGLEKEVPIDDTHLHWRTDETKDKPSLFSQCGPRCGFILLFSASNTLMYIQTLPAYSISKSYEDDINVIVKHSSALS